jgi:hypothetical protein
VVRRTQARNGRPTEAAGAAGYENLGHRTVLSGVVCPQYPDQATLPQAPVLVTFVLGGAPHIEK